MLIEILRTRLADTTTFVLITTLIMRAVASWSSWRSAGELRHLPVDLGHGELVRTFGLGVLPDGLIG